MGSACTDSCTTGVLSCGSGLNCSASAKMCMRLGMRQHHAGLQTVIIIPRCVCKARCTASSPERAGAVVYPGGVAWLSCRVFTPYARSLRKIPFFLQSQRFTRVQWHTEVPKLSNIEPLWVILDRISVFPFHCRLSLALCLAAVRLPTSCLVRGEPMKRFNRQFLP